MALDLTYITPMFVMGIFSLFGGMVFKRMGEDMYAILFTILAVTCVTGSGVGLLYQGFEIIYSNYTAIQF